MSRGADVAVCAWFLLVMFTFWGPYFGWGASPNVTTALYAVFLLVAVVTLVLGILKQKQRETVEQGERTGYPSD